MRGERARSAVADGTDGECLAGCRSCRGTVAALEIRGQRQRLDARAAFLGREPALALSALNERGVLTVGLDSEGSDDLAKVELREPLALVLGAEGKGLRQLTRQTCSVVARLDMPGEIKSLNVSNAAVLALYIGAVRLGLMG